MKLPAITQGNWNAEDAAVWTDQGDLVLTTKDRADALKFDPRTVKPEERANAKAAAALPALLSQPAPSLRP